jgi:cytochrome c oxidase subunit 2
VAVFIFGAVLFVVVRYRRQDDELPRQRDGFPVLEILYALGLAAIVAVLLSATFSTNDRETKLSGHPGLRMHVTAFQWGWRFRYPGGATVVGDERHAPTMVVPTDTDVRFTLHSHDVIHAFWIPELRFKRDAFPERTTNFDLSFDDRTAKGRCAEFCGLAHADMTFDVLALPPAQFDDWLQTQNRES